MIRHNDEFVQLRLWKMIRDFQPTLLGPFPTFIDPHFPVYNFTKQTCAIVRHDGDEIGTRPGVIVSLQTNGLTVVFREIHYFLSLPVINLIPFFIFFLPQFVFLLPSGRRGDRRGDRGLIISDTFPPQIYLILFVFYPIPFRLSIHSFFPKTYLFVWLLPD